MTLDTFKNLVQEIVAEAQKLSAAHTDSGNAPVNYSCIFSHSPAEYKEMTALAEQLGSIVQETAMGPIFQIDPIATEAGSLALLKVRKPEARRHQLGYADFTVADYTTFKQTYLGRAGFRLIKRSEYETVELSDDVFTALAYYAYPPLPDVLKIVGA